MLLSIIGYGIAFDKLFLKQKKLEYGLYGILGIILLTFYSYISNLLISHGQFHNLIIHFVGLFFFSIFFNNNKKIFLFSFLILFLILIPSLIISKYR